MVVSYKDSEDLYDRWFFPFLISVHHPNSRLKIFLFFMFPLQLSNKKYILR